MAAPDSLRPPSRSSRYSARGRPFPVSIRTDARRPDQGPGQSRPGRAPRAVVVACRRRPGPIKYLLEPGTVLPLHAGATGRSILGRLGISALGEESLEAHTPETVTERAELESLLAEGARAGYTISVGQQFPLAAGAAA
ncbi:IclR family transcriptional regulator C-terminal domain-containing protein [Arthrobacter sp. NPDC093139]|uniref:IclR family transcriptional regulator domain-containing protein n=1 Tax=Arthrobacter sp. NPDC093139 TaxID=3363945 RepID=UPI003811C10D